MPVRWALPTCLPVRLPAGRGRSATMDDHRSRRKCPPAGSGPAGACSAAADPEQAAFRPRRHGAAERGRRRRRCAYSVFWVMVVLTGVAAGLFGDVMMLILFSVQHLAFGYHGGSPEAAVSRSSDARRVVVLVARRVRRGRLVPAAQVHARRADGDRRRGVRRGGAAVVPAVAGHLGDLRDHDPDGRRPRDRHRGRPVRDHPGAPARAGCQTAASASPGGRACSERDRDRAGPGVTPARAGCGTASRRPRRSAGR